MEKCLYTSNHQLFPYCSLFLFCFLSYWFVCYDRWRESRSNKTCWLPQGIRKNKTRLSSNIHTKEMKFLIGLYACFDIVRITFNMQFKIKNTHYNQQTCICVLFLLIIINVILFRYYSSSCHLDNSLDNLDNCIR